MIELLTVCYKIVLSLLAQMMYLGVTGTICTLFVSLFKEEISVKSQVNILTETVDYIPFPC